MKKYMVGAYKKGKFSHWASVQYDTRKPATEYCTECIRVCAPYTGMEYRVEEVDS